MTPAPPPRAQVGAMLKAALGMVLLAFLFLRARDAVRHSLAAQWRPSAGLAGVLFLIAVAALASPRLVTGLVPSRRRPAKGMESFLASFLAASDDPD